jgi:AraC-like DNA-binding protein
MRRKIERAKQLLQSGHENVTDVAMQLGFSTPAYFATVFKRYTGQSPHTYRE